MEVCVARVKGRDVMLRLEGALVYLDGRIENIKGLRPENIEAFAAELAAVPVEDHPGYHARLNARRAAFLVNLLGMAAGEESQDAVTRLLDSVHYDVLEFLGETENA